MISNPHILADNILRAAGSGMQYYTLPKTREAIIKAARDTIEFYNDAHEDLMTALDAIIEELKNPEYGQDFQRRYDHLCKVYKGGLAALAKARGETA